MEEERDRMSQLPDDILLLILGKMDTIEAAKTTILSNRWKNLWRLVPNLRFHLSCIGHHVRDLKDLTIRFSHMVSRCLSHRDSAAAVHDFHLSLDARYSQVDDEFLEEWVLYAINHDVQSVRVDTGRSLTLPVAFLSCKTLRELDLRQSYFVSVPGRLSLPNCKTLYLETELFFRGNHNEVEPFSGLPELEKLTLIGSFVYGLVIKAPKLRVLEITTTSVVKEIYTPLLTSFRYESDRAWECATVNLPMLEQLYLDIHESSPWHNYWHSVHFVRMLHQFESATTISLTLDTLRVLEFNGGPFEQTPPPPFPNMKCLKVIEGRHGIRTVFQGVMNYLTGTLYSEVEFPPNVIVVEQIFDIGDYEQYGKSDSIYTDSD